MERTVKARLPLLDTLRGGLLVSMIGYHACWDMVYLFGAPWPWFLDWPAYAWQQATCWGFLLLSGLCWSLSRGRPGRGLAVFGAGGLITAVTVLAMPEQRVLFGVLTLLGSCMLLLRPLKPWLERLPAGLGLAVCLALFLLLRPVGAGTLGLGPWRLALPHALYRNLFTAYLGFPPAGFFSTDYFPLLPWSLLFLGGFFLGRMARRRGWLEALGRRPGLAPLSWLGRRSLILYLVHQPAVYGLLWLAHR